MSVFQFLSFPICNVDEMLVPSFVSVLCYLLPFLCVRTLPSLLHGCQCFSSSITIDAIRVDEPCRLNFKENLKVAQFPAEYLLLMDSMLFFFSVK